MSKNSKPSNPGVVHAPHPNPPPAITKRLTGSDYEKFSSILMGQIGNALWVAHSTEDQAQTQIDACAEALAGIAPQDEAEGMLAAQMVACHHAAMECYRRAMISDQPFLGRQQNLNFATKLTRAYALHMEALDRHRGKGQQTVRVEHVTVNAGGQAIVGTVQTRAGVEQKSGEQAHAETIAHAPEPAMRSPFETDREAMPERRDDER